MRIVPYDGEENIEDIQSLAIMVKAIPFEGGFVPAFALIAPSDYYKITIGELSALMDGIEISQTRIDSLISEMLLSRRMGVADDEMGEEDSDEDGNDF